MQDIYLSFYNSLSMEALQVDYLPGMCFLILLDGEDPQESGLNMGAD